MNLIIQTHAHLSSPSYPPPPHHHHHHHNGLQTSSVFGASGISGWAIVRECLAQPDFSHVIAITKRSLSKDEFLLDSSSKLDLYNGVNLTEDLVSVTAKLRQIAEIDKVTHVFYTGRLAFPVVSIANGSAYCTHGSGFQKLKATNVAMLDNAVKAVTSLCPNLQFWALQTGGKAYGVEFYGQKGVEYIPPLKETASRIPEPYASNIFYYPQYDLLKAASEGKAWSFCEVRPDLIIGFTPHGNGIGFAQTLGLFLSMYASVRGRGSTVTFPGNQAVWKALHSDSSQDVVAKFHIHASTAAGLEKGGVFNIADEDSITWERLWPDVYDYFGLKGVGPAAEGDADQKLGLDWVMSMKPEWPSWVERNGLKGGALETASWDVMVMVFRFGFFDRQYDLSAAKGTGFVNDSKTIEGYRAAFDRMKVAKMIV